MQRFYTEILKKHFQKNRQMAFISGPRQVGKTTVCKHSAEGEENYYFNWDNSEHRRKILEGPKSLAQAAGLNKLTSAKPFLILDEIHKYTDWKNFLKGFFDTYGEKYKILISGSAKLDFFKQGGDSLMGRYFSYRIHPLSIRELIDPSLNKKELSKPQEISDKLLTKLLTFGGFPEPFLKKDQLFYNQWKKLRKQQLFKEDLSDLTKIYDVQQMEVLADILKIQAGSLTNFSSLAKKVRISHDTVQRWLAILKGLYYCYVIRPWSKNISRSLIKEPKIYLWDWSLVEDTGARLENFVASHLLKAVHFWTDYGFGEYDLYYLRDKDKREVDFLVTKDKQPWFLVEVKNSDKELSKSLYHFQKQTKAKHAFQINANAPFVDRDCFEIKKPVIVPLKTFLSQLI